MMIKKILTVLGTSVFVHGVAAAQGPTMQFGHADLVRPQAADQYYSSVPAQTDMTAVSNFRPEINALARGLRNDPDRIYEYVRNNVMYTPMFGLQKGALGTSIDMAGTAFDQADLMVQLLRKSGFTASYVYGDITVNGSEFKSWFGFDDAQAGCQYLANGGIPATVNGAQSCSEISGTVSSATLRHVWVKANIDGTDYQFDPAFKQHKIIDGIDLKSAMGFGGESALINAAGGNASTVNGNPAIRNLDQNGVNSIVDGYAQSLISFLSANHVDSDIEDLIGGLDIEPENVPPTGKRLTSLSGHNAILTWNEIPSAYKTIFSFVVDEKGGFGGTVNALRTQFKFYTNEVYGRRLTIDRIAFDYDPASSFHNGGSTSYDVTFRIDDIPIEGVPLDGQPDGKISSHLNLGLFHSSNIFSTTYSINHPYAYQNGVYMDREYNRGLSSLDQPLAIVLTLGYSSSSMTSALSQERLDGVKQNHGYACLDSSGDPFSASGSAQVETRNADNPILTQIGYGWVSQFTMALELQARASDARAQHHHSIGIVNTPTTLDTACKPPPGIENTGEFRVIDQVTIIDILSGVSITMIDSLPQNDELRKAIQRSVAILGSVLEGSIFEQVQNKPYSSSTTSRFLWANENLPDNNFIITSSSTLQGFLPADPMDEQNPNNTQTPMLSGTMGSGVQVQTFSEIDRIHIGVEHFDYGHGLGPGPKYGPVIPGAHQAYFILSNDYDQSDFDEAFANGYFYHRSKQRGSAFLSFTSDASEVAHVVTVVGEAAQRSKGGGSGQNLPGDGAEQFDPSNAADILRDTFEDRSSLHGVDLQSGTFSLAGGADVTVGAGDFPYSLSFERRFSAGGRKSRGLGAGWTHNWDMNISMSGSGMEAMGYTTALAGTASLVVAALLPEIYLQADSADANTLKRNLVAMIVADWWRENLRYNVATVREGFSTTQFVRLPNGEFAGPSGSTVTLEQTGTRTLGLRSHGAQVDQVNCNGTGQLPCPLTETPIWYDDDVSFKLTTASGSETTFKSWHRILIPPTGGQQGDGYIFDFPQSANVGGGFLATEWKSASGYKVQLEYDAEVRLSRIINDSGREFALFYDEQTFANSGLSITDRRLTQVRPRTNGEDLPPVLFTYEFPDVVGVDGSPTIPVNGVMPGEASNVPILTTVTNALGQVMRYEYTGAKINTATQRRQWYPHLSKMYSPQDPNTPVMEIEYDGAWRVKKLCDARANPDACQ